VKNNNGQILFALLPFSNYNLKFRFNYLWHAWLVCKTHCNNFEREGQLEHGRSRRMWEQCVWWMWAWRILASRARRPWTEMPGNLKFLRVCLIHEYCRHWPLNDDDDDDSETFIHVKSDYVMSKLHCWSIYYYWKMILKYSKITAFMFMLWQILKLIVLFKWNL